MRRLCLLVLAACCPNPPGKSPVAIVPRAPVAAPAPPPVEASLDTLREGVKLHGFTAHELYLDDADRPIGARFVHDKTGFTFDYLRIESAPQGYIWVHSYPTSDKGEPHTQEHLLLGKGDRGRRLGSTEAMALAESSAFTSQWHTAYHFHTVAGNDVYWSVFENQLDALLNPDYSDEEIRREVRNFGVDKGDDGVLRLEEKGTVYNEMVRTYEQPETGMWHVAGQLVYGARHPLALESGGYPDAIRTMTPADIRTFHDANYHLANMGVIGAFPSTMTLDTILDRTAQILYKEAGRTGRVTTAVDLPKPAPAAPGTIQIVDYPYSDTTSPSPMMLMWPATRELDDTERMLLGLFLDAFAGDESTTLYKKLIDSKTRAIDLGANGVWSSLSLDQGQPVMIGVNGVKPDKLDDKTVGDIRTLVLAEFERLAKLRDGDPELVAFDQRVASRVIDVRRRYAKFLDTPPGFGVRGTSQAWFDHLDQLAKTKGFQKSLTMRPALAEVEKILAGPANPWRERVRAWGLVDVPYGIAARPSPALRTQLDLERKQRIEAELARLPQAFHVSTAKEALEHYQRTYEADTKKLEDSAKMVELPSLVASPPMTLDDGLQYTTGEIGEVRTFSAMFDTMASARVQLAFDVRGRLAADDQMFLAALPALLGDAGVIEDGKPISAGDMRERMRKEILDLSVNYSDNARTGRVELVIAGSGNGADETAKALAWMRRVMFAPDWRLENLSRLRDRVDQELTEVRHRMLGAEENWVTGPRDAWWRQRQSEYLHAESFLTRAHDLHRLRWMLEDPRDPKVTAEVTAVLSQLAATKLGKKQLAALAAAIAQGTDPRVAKLSPTAKAIAQDAGKDLAALVPDLPDETAAGDWSYLCREMAHDLKVGAQAALARLEEVRKAVINTAHARLVQVGAAATQSALAGEVARLVHDIPTAGSPSPTAAAEVEPLWGRVVERTKAKPSAGPRFVGLFAPATSSGVFLNQARLTSYAETADDPLLDYLASNLYTGHGGHSIFMKTWAAGLAYSNGLHPRVSVGQVDYYAERCPLLPQTLRFVINELRKAKPDPSLARYAIATAFTSRIADGYEARAAAMAADLVDELPPDVVRAFRAHLLEEANRSDLAQALFARMESVYGRVLPGYGKLDPGGIYFVIGPEKQLTAYQDYLHAAIGKDATLYRLYPRDFWIPAKL